MYDAISTLEQFNKLMVDIRDAIPAQYEGFIKQKESIIKSGKIPEKTKWLLLLVSSVTAKCPVCISRAVVHCIEAGWSKEEMLEAGMVAVLVGGSSAMTYLTLAEKTIEELQGK